jgi:WD40 repeat protein/uncharacterized caspase-like protein
MKVDNLLWLVALTLLLGPGLCVHGQIERHTLAPRVLSQGPNSAPAKPELFVETGHTETVFAAAYSPDGRLIVTAGGDRMIKLWDAQTGQEIRSLSGLGEYATLTISPDGRRLAAGGRDKTIKVWDAATGRLVQTLSGHETEVRQIAFSHDGRWLASSGETELKLWDAGTGRAVWSVIAHDEPHSCQGGMEPSMQVGVGYTKFIRALAFSPDDRLLASGGWECSVRVWEAASGRRVLNLIGHSDNIETVVFSPDGRTLYSAGDTTIQFWDIPSGRKGRALSDKEFLIRALAISTDGRWLASADDGVELWDINSGKMLRRFAQEQTVVAVAFSPDGQKLVTGDIEHTARIWDTVNGSELRVMKPRSSGVQAVAFSPDGRLLAVGNDANAVILWELVTGREVRRLEGEGGSVNSLAFSPDGRLLATTGQHNLLLESGRQVKVWDLSNFATRSFRDHSEAGFGEVTFSRDGRWLAASNSDKIFSLWDVATGREVSGERKKQWISGGAVAFRPDGQKLATGFEEDQLKLWDVPGGGEAGKLTGHMYNSGITYLKTDRGLVGTRFGPYHSISSLAFSPDGRWLASSVIGVTDSSVEIWDLNEGREVHNLTGHTGPVSVVAFTGDGRYLATAGTDATIKLWDVSTGRELRTLAGHTDGVNSISLSLDGRWLVSGSGDGTARLWDTQTGQELCRLISFHDGSWAVVDPEGRFDTDNLEEIRGLHWLVPDEPLRPLPAEIFMRDYYEPQLLPRLLKCNRENNCDKKFKPVRDISKLNRVQPPVKIAKVSLPDAEGYVGVTIEVGKGEGKYLVEGKESTRTTGVYDLRLFRDGQMVGSWPTDGAEQLLQRTAKDFASSTTLTGEQRLLKELGDWRGTTEVKPDDKVKIDQKTGMMTLPPFRVKLPRGKDSSEIEFSAYAFNEDRIKSQTAHWQWPDDLKAKLPKSQPVKPRAYIIAVGVNAYENPDFDLEFAADDARRMAEVITEKLNATGQYEKVIPVTLVSDHEVRGNRKIATLKQATKENFRAVLERLAGRNDDGKLLDGVMNAEQLQRATPDDFVIIMYSSHGYADRAGNFYFIPYDTGPGKGKVFTESVRRHGISSEELSLWLRDVDAGEMVMIVDACHSTAAVAGQDFKPGPMGSRGLGQLSYDKAMRILTATQSDNVAWEYPTLKQGMLTYALIRDGIEAKQADHDRDNTITIEEWLAYGVDRVPKLYGEVRTGKVQSFGLGASGQPRLVATRDGKPTSGTKELEEVLATPGNSATIQQPSLFDFARKRKQVPLVKTY